MRRFGAFVAALALGSLAAGCASGPPAPTFQPPPGSASGAPYDVPPVGNDKLTLTLDMRAAREILALLSQATYSPAAAKQLETLPAVELAIRESGRPPETFERDLAAAFDAESRTSIFDFQRIREDRGRWEDLLAMISSQEAALTKLASNRARALLPTDRPLSVTLPFYLTFGLASRADHIALPGVDGAEWGVVIDLSRSVSETESATPQEQIHRLARLMASEAYQRAWAEYRTGSPAWEKRDPSLGQLEPLLHVVAEAGPIAIYNVDENFFPLSVWLKGPMKTSMDELNRVADRLVSAEADLDARMAAAGDIKKPEFVSGVAGPAGAFVADGIIQALGVEAYRTALAGGPRAFFEAYQQASEKLGKSLIPLAKVIQDQLATPAK